MSARDSTRYHLPMMMTKVYHVQQSLVLLLMHLLSYYSLLSKVGLFATVYIHLLLMLDYQLGVLLHLWASSQGYAKCNHLF